MSNIKTITDLKHKKINVVKVTAKESKNSNPPTYDDLVNYLDESLDMVADLTVKCQKKNATIKSQADVLDLLQKNRDNLQDENKILRENMTATNPTHASRVRQTIQQRESIITSSQMVDEETYRKQLEDLKRYYCVL